MKHLTIPAWCAEKPKRSWGTDLLLFLALLLLLQLTEGIIVGIATVIRIFRNGTDDALLSGVLPEELMLVSLFSTLPATAAVLLLCRYTLGLSPGGLEQLSGAAEAYLLTQLERGFRTLDFYKELAAPFAVPTKQE